MQERKMSFGEIYGASWAVYTRNFAYMAVITLLGYGPIAITTMFMPQASFDVILNMYSLAPEQLNKLMTSSIFMLGLYVLFLPPTISAITSVTASYIVTGKATVERTLSDSLAKWGWLALSGAIFATIVLLTAALVIPAIFFFVSFYFFPNLAVLMKLGSVRSLQASYQIVKKHWFATLGFIISNFLLSVVATSLLSALFSWISLTLVGFVIITLIVQLGGSYFTIASTIYIMNKMLLLGKPMAPLANNEQ
jgi:hypothetical protein